MLERHNYENDHKDGCIYGKQENRGETGGLKLEAGRAEL